MANPDPPCPAGRRKRLVFLHLPKTGGTALHQQLLTNFRPEEVCPIRFSRLVEQPREALERYVFFSGHFNFDHVRHIPGETYVVTVLREPRQRILSNYYFWKRHRAEVVERQNLEGPRIARRGNLLDFLRSDEPVVTDSTDNQIARYLAGNVTVGRDGRYRRRVGGVSVELSPLEIVQMALANLQTVAAIGFAETLDAVHARVARDLGLRPVATLPRVNTRDEERPEFEPVAEEEVTPEVARELDRLTAMDRVVVQLARRHARHLAARGPAGNAAAPAAAAGS